MFPAPVTPQIKVRLKPDILFQMPDVFPYQFTIRKRLGIIGQ
jgi:hypothetical protein